MVKQSDTFPLGSMSPILRPCFTWTPFPDQSPDDPSDFCMDGPACDLADPVTRLHQIPNVQGVLPHSVGRCPKDAIRSDAHHRSGNSRIGFRTAFGEETAQAMSPAGFHPIVGIPAHFETRANGNHQGGILHGGAQVLLGDDGIHQDLGPHGVPGLACRVHEDRDLPPPQTVGAPSTPRTSTALTPSTTASPS